MRRNKIKEEMFSEELWKTSFCFTDIYDYATDSFREKVDAMTIHQFKKFFDENSHGWKKGFEAGIMFD